jgi:phage shock protein A
MYDERVGDAFARFDQVERALDELEGKVDIYDLAKPRGVAEELAELQSDQQVEGELAALKAKLAGTGDGR